MFNIDDIRYPIYACIYFPEPKTDLSKALVTNTLANAVRTIFLPLRKWSKIVRTTFVRVFVTKAEIRALYTKTSSNRQHTPPIYFLEPINHLFMVVCMHSKQSYLSCSNLFYSLDQMHCSDRLPAQWSLGNEMMGHPSKKENACRSTFMLLRSKVTCVQTLSTIAHITRCRESDRVIHITYQCAIPQTFAAPYVKKQGQCSNMHTGITGTTHTFV